MQEWLKDKKNLPIIGALVAAALIGALVLVLFETGVLPPQPAPVAVASTDVQAPPRPGAPSPGVVPSQRPPAGIAPPIPARPAGLPLPGGVPGRAAAAPGGVPGQATADAGVAGAKAPAAPLNPAKGPDPFKVPGYHPFQASQAALSALRVRNALPPVFIQQYTPKDQLIIKTTQGQQNTQIASLTPEVSTTMRMSGVITSDNSIKALLEDNGVTSQVQPGDTVDGGKVLSIQADGLTLRTGDNRLVRVPLSGTSTGGNSPYGGNGPAPGGGNDPPPPGND